MKKETLLLLVIFQVAMESWAIAPLPKVAPGDLHTVEKSPRALTVFEMVCVRISLRREHTEILRN